MRLLIFVVTILIMFVLKTGKVEAIVVIVPTVLIPIVQILAWVIAAITTPVLTLSSLYAKNKNKSFLFGLFIGLVVILIITIIVVVSFKLIDPYRPLY